MIDHCQELVAKADKDRYLSCLYAPAAKRPHLFALYAFNIEITRIRESVSEPQIGLVRQQWWLDTIEGIYAGTTQDHPVAQALARAIEAANLPKQPLSGLIIAHELDLYDDPFPSLNDLEGYLGETSSALIQMACLILGSSAPEAAGLAGVAFGIAKMLPDQRAPKDIDLKAHARKRLAEARAIGIPPLALPAFLPASLTELYLDHPTTSQFRRQITLWWAARNNRF